MGGFFGMLATLFSKLGTFSDYITSGLLDIYNGMGMWQKTVMYLFLVILVLIAVYIIALILRFHFKFSTRKLKNIKREYQITINRANGKHCNVFWDILLYQKMVIVDDKVVPRENKQQLLTA